MSHSVKITLRDFPRFSENPLVIQMRADEGEITQEEADKLIESCISWNPGSKIKEYMDENNLTWRQYWQRQPYTNKTGEKYLNRHTKN